MRHASAYGWPFSYVIPYSSKKLEFNAAPPYGKWDLGSLDSHFDFQYKKAVYSIRAKEQTRA